MRDRDGADPSSSIDQIDEKILAMLKEDGRTSHVDMAKLVGLSEAAIRRRVSNLVKSGVISKFTIETSVGRQANAITLVSVSPSAPTAEVSARLKHIRGVDSVFEITGEYDIAAIVSGSNIAEINRIIDEIRKTSSVHDTNTVMVLRKVR